jgi:hypothetical protein
MKVGVIKSRVQEFKYCRFNNSIHNQILVFIADIILPLLTAPSSARTTLLLHAHTQALSLSLSPSLSLSLSPPLSS